MVAVFPPQPTAHALGDEPTAEEVKEALWSLGNSKVVGLDELPVELLKLGLHHDPTVLREFHQIIIGSGVKERYPKGDVTKKDPTERGKYRGISLVAHVSAKYSSK